MNKTFYKQLQQAKESTQGRWVIRQHDSLENVCEITIIPDGKSVYAGGVFFLNMSFPSEYPFKPPQITMSTRIYHPNVSRHREHMGRLYIDILYGDWTPHCTITRLLEYICDLFNKPCMDSLSICNQDAGHIYKTDPDRFRQIAQEWTKKYAL